MNLIALQVLVQVWIDNWLALFGLSSAPPMNKSGEDDMYKAR